MKVTELQQALRDLGYDLVDDGIYGPRTRAAVVDFQTRHNLVPDGVVGPKTELALRDARFDVYDAAMPLQRCVPLRRLADGRAPHITSGHKDRNPERKNHNGCDFFFEYKPGDPPMKVGDGGRTAKWWIPEGTQAIASADGRVVLASWSRTGYRVWIDHGGMWLTGYFHLDKLGTQVGAIVPMGYPLGRVSHNPIDSDAKHLHFEVFRGHLSDYPGGNQDPEKAWLVGAEICPA